MDLAVRHQIDRIELVVLVERANDLGQVFSRERLAAREHQNAEIAAERFGDLGDLVSLHLQLFTRPVVQLLGKKAVRAPHIANARNQNIQKNRRDRPSDHDARVSFKNLFCCKIHLFSRLHAAPEALQSDLVLTELAR